MRRCGTLIVNDRQREVSSAKRPPGSTYSHGAAASVSAPGTIKAPVQKNITPTGIKSVLAPRHGCPIEHQIPSRQFVFLLWDKGTEAPPAGMKAISVRVTARLQSNTKGFVYCSIAVAFTVAHASCLVRAAGQTGHKSVMMITVSTNAGMPSAGAGSVGFWRVRLDTCQRIKN